MNEDTKKFELKLNGESIFIIEASGTKEIVDAFEKKCITSSWGLFEDFNKTVGKILLNEIEVKMGIVFRDKKGHFVNPKKIISTKQK